MKYLDRPKKGQSFFTKWILLKKFQDSSSQEKVEEKKIFLSCRSFSRSEKVSLLALMQRRVEVENGQSHHVVILQQLSEAFWKLMNIWVKTVNIKCLVINANSFLFQLFFPFFQNWTQIMKLLLHLSYISCHVSSQFSEICYLECFVLVGRVNVHIVM